MLELIKRLFQSQQERTYRRQLAERPPLPDTEFAKRYFPTRQHTIATIVARVARKQLRIESLSPEDNLAVAFPDVDFNEIACDVMEELGVDPWKVDELTLDGTVGNLVNELTML